MHRIQIRREISPCPCCRSPARCGKRSRSCSSVGAFRARSFPGCWGSASERCSAHAQQEGLPIAGLANRSLRRDGGGRSLTVEAAVPLAAPAAGEGEMEAGSLPGGPNRGSDCMRGAYDTLPETHVAMERWIESKGYHANGAPWEQYVTDPGEHPEPGGLAHRGVLAAGGMMTVPLEIPGARPTPPARAARGSAVPESTTRCTTSRGTEVIDSGGVPPNSSIIASASSGRTSTPLPSRSLGIARGDASRMMSARLLLDQRVRRLPHFSRRAATETPAQTASARRPRRDT